MEIPLPVVIAKEGKWFVASCPVLDIATQGETEQEIKEMSEDLINDYFKDPDTLKSSSSKFSFSCDSLSLRNFIM